MCNVTHSRRARPIYVWHDSFMCDTTLSRMNCLPPVRRDSFMYSCETWLIHMWHDSVTYDMTLSGVTWLMHVRHDPFMNDMTHSCVTDSFIPYMHRYCVSKQSAHEHYLYFLRFILLCCKSTRLYACSHPLFFFVVWLSFAVMKGFFADYRALLLRLQRSFSNLQGIHLSSFWCDLIFGHRIWVDWIWASLQETCIALHLVCALYAI